MYMASAICIWPRLYVYGLGRAPADEPETQLLIRPRCGAQVSGFFGRSTGRRVRGDGLTSQEAHNYLR